MKVYLAGGFRNNWQEKVIAQIPEITFFNPRDKESDGKMSLDEYGTWDLHHIKISDIVFVYMEKDNPSGIGTAVETGYSHGVNKTIILVLEPGHETINDRYLQFLKKAANISFETLDEGIKYLKTFV